jgi:uncharacterized OsmC-like protein
MADHDDAVAPQRWQVRGRWADQATRVYVRNHGFTVGVQASLRDADPHPSALEYLLGALAGDLLRGVALAAARRRIEIHDMEASLSGQLDNPLVHLGVIGESGHAGLAVIEGTIWLSAELDDAMLAEVWREASSRSPCHQTLARSVALDIRLRVTI